MCVSFAKQTQWLNKIIFCFWNIVEWFLARPNSVTEDIKCLLVEWLFWLLDEYNFDWARKTMIDKFKHVLNLPNKYNGDWTCSMHFEKYVLKYL